MRALLRKLLPASFYRGLARCYSLLLSLREGPGLLLALLFSKGERTQRFRRLLHPFTFRCGTADDEVVLQNIVRGECVLGALPDEARFIVDGGGYIGDTASVFLSLYPGAQCVVLEPSSNHELAVRNLAPYGARARVLRAALTREAGWITITEEFTGSRVSPALPEAGAVQALPMAEILALSPSGMIDLLKLDIEGAEWDLLRPPTPWLAQVRCLVVELHGEAANRDIPRWMTEAGFAVAKHRSLYFFTRR